MRLDRFRALLVFSQRRSKIEKLPSSRISSEALFLADAFRILLIFASQDVRKIIITLYGRAVGGQRRAVHKIEDRGELHFSGTN